MPAEARAQNTTADTYKPLQCTFQLSCGECVRTHRLVVFLIFVHIEFTLLVFSLLLVRNAATLNPTKVIERMGGLGANMNLSAHHNTRLAWWCAWSLDAL